MTPTRKCNYCPVCSKVYAALAQHLRRTHQVMNRDERILLLNMSTGRVNIRTEPCPVFGCSYHSTRLDRHLANGHPELDGDMVSLKLDEVKREMTVRLLVALRATHPLVAMSTGLDLHLPEETDHQPEEPDNQREQDDALCHLPQCIEMNEKLKCSEHRLIVVEKELQRTLKLLQRVRKRERRLIKKATVRAACRADAGPSREAEAVLGLAEEVHGAEEESEEEAGPSHKKPDASPMSRRKAVRVFLTQQGRHSKSGKIQLPKEIVQYLEGYMELHGATRGNSKRKDNAKSKLNRIKTFIFYLAYGEEKLWDWCFMDNVAVIMSYAEYLGEVGMKVTTCNYYLQNIHHFVKYLTEAPPKSSRLTVAQRARIVRAVETSMADLTRSVVLHRQKVKAGKMSRIMSTTSLRMCQTKARTKIPLLLDQMEAAGCGVTLRDTFYGYLAAYLTSIYGHRPGVLANMTVDEVKEASGQARDNVPGFLIAIDDHKTNTSFGAALIYLHADEYSWLERWIQLREGLNPENNRLLITSGTGPVKNLAHCLQTSWADMGLPGRPTFNDIRTALSAHVKIHKPADVRKKITDFMCHHTETADRFYALSLDRRQAADVRKQLESVVRSPPPQSTSSTAQGPP